MKLRNSSFDYNEFSVILKEKLNTNFNTLFDNENDIK